VCVQERDQNGKKESLSLSLFRQRGTENPISREGKHREREREREREKSFVDNHEGSQGRTPYRVTPPLGASGPAHDSKYYIPLLRWPFGTPWRAQVGSDTRVRPNHLLPLLCDGEREDDASRGRRQGKIPHGYVRRRRLRFNRCTCGDRIIVERDPQSDEVPGEKIE
jgi:hypothetical protein